MKNYRYKKLKLLFVKAGLHNDIVNHFIPEKNRFLIINYEKKIVQYIYLSVS